VDLALNCVVDSSSLIRACNLAKKSSSRSVELIVKSSAFQVAIKAQRYTPFVTQEKIDADLDKIATPAQGNKRRKSWGSVTVAQAVVLARMHPGSRYSIMTDNRWPIVPPEFHGRRDAGPAFWGFVVAAAERMRSARHSSTHFLIAGWVAVARKIKASGFGGRSLGGSAIIDVEAEVINDAGEVLNTETFGTFTQGGSPNLYWMKIENLIGMDKSYPNLSRTRNEALLEKGGPALQRALNEQTSDMQRHYLPKVGEDLAREWNAIK